MQKNDIGPPTSHYIEELFKMEQKPKCRAKAIKLLENIGVSLYDLGLGNSFLITTPKT